MSVCSLCLEQSRRAHWQASGEFVPATFGVLRFGHLGRLSLHADALERLLLVALDIVEVGLYLAYFVVASFDLQTGESVGEVH